MTFSWDEFKTEGAFVKFETVGDSIAGTVTDVRPGTDFNGNPCPELELTTPDGEVRILSCGQANLKHQMLEIRPNVGDTLVVTYSHQEKAALGMRKMFKIEHASPLGATPVKDEEAPF